ncbi:MAG: hypothetical protein Q9201_007064, partial [Fulgogasparrea decipioides]
AEQEKKGLTEAAYKRCDGSGEATGHSIEAATGERVYLVAGQKEKNARPGTSVKLRGRKNSQRVNAGNYLRPKEWAPYKEKVIRLVLDEGRSLTEVMREVTNSAFQPTQLQYRLKCWLGERHTLRSLTDRDKDWAPNPVSDVHAWLARRE